MAIRVQCPTCGKRFDAPEKWAGMATACLNCDGTIHVPQRAAQLPALQQLEWPEVVAGPIPIRSYQPARSAVPWALVIGVALVAFTVGFFAGREYLKWEARSALSNVQEMFRR